MLTQDKYLTAKEISGYLQEEMQLIVSPDYVRRMWRAGCPHLGRQGRIDELLVWWKQNPDIRLTSRKNRYKSKRIGSVRTD